MYFKRSKLIGLSLVLVPLLALAASPVFAMGSSFSKYVDDKGNILLPQDPRKNLVHLGSWFVPEGDVSGFHDVYTEASTVDAYRSTGEFPDGAALVKELRKHNSGDYPTGANVSYPNSDVRLWFVMVKDSTNRFPGNPLWAKGWGWSMFQTDNPAKNVATSFEKACQACHTPAKETGWVFIEGYQATLGKPLH